VLDEHVEFLERALVEQKLDALARGELPRAWCASMRISPPPSFAAEPELLAQGKQLREVPAAQMAITPGQRPNACETDLLDAGGQPSVGQPSVAQPTVDPHLINLAGLRT
jgi:hypothetical protein